MVEASLNGFLSSNVALTKLAEGETGVKQAFNSFSRHLEKNTEISNTRPYYSKDYFWRGGGNIISTAFSV